MTSSDALRNNSLKAWHLLLAVAVLAGGIVAGYYRAQGQLDHRISEVRETYVTRSDLKGDLAEIKGLLWGLRADVELVRREQSVTAEIVRELRRGRERPVLPSPRARN